MDITINGEPVGGGHGSFMAELLNGLDRLGSATIYFEDTNPSCDGEISGEELAHSYSAEGRMMFADALGGAIDHPWPIKVEYIEALSTISIECGQHSWLLVSKVKQHA